VIFLKILLFPFTIIYACITTCRNKLFDIGLLKSIQVPVAVVCVGNLKAGGTGKTPFTQYLVNTLSSSYKTAVLSRGYGRKTKGFVLADKNSSINDIGDESFQVYSHANNKYVVAVCEDRVDGVNALLKIYPDLKLVILDDGYQHRKIKRDVNILITEYQDPFFNDYLLPAGRLRECKSGAARADVVVVTKSPTSYKPLSLQGFLPYIKPRVPVHYTSISYGLYQSQITLSTLNSKVIVVTGIANPNPLLTYLKEQKLDIVKHFNYADHYSFTSKDILIVEQESKRYDSVQIITTEKDWVKIVPLLKGANTPYIWGYIPIELVVCIHEPALLDLVQQKINKRLYSLS
jgi:tetraacyldisaccharide 4'-kinase